jgi:uncharacterized protein (TIGR02246 family)
MNGTDAVTHWIQRYRAAWESNDPSEIGGLFADDAVYFTEPFAQPWRGRAQIVAGWLEHRDNEGETTFDWHPLSVTEDVAIIQGETGYPDRRYSNLWVIRLDNTGQCRQFTEWWMLHHTHD